MFLDLNPKDWIQIVIWIGGLIGAVAIIKTDIRWLVRWSETHQKTDDLAYDSIKEDIRELRNELNNRGRGR